MSEKNSGKTRALLPVAQRRAAIAHAGTDEAVVGVLLERVRNPSRGATDGENRRGHRALKAEHAGAYGQVEIEVGAQPLAFRYCRFDFERSLEQPAATALRDRFRDLPQQRGARIAVGIDCVSEARR